MKLQRFICEPLYMNNNYIFINIENIIKLVYL